MNPRSGLKRLYLTATGKEEKPLVLVVRSGDADRWMRMESLLRGLLPGQEFAVVEDSGRPAGEQWLELRWRFERRRIALAAVLFDGDARFEACRRAVMALAPTKVLAFNRNLERYHLRWTAPLSSTLFLRQVPLDRIHLRPWWLAPWKKDRSVLPRVWNAVPGRGFRPHRPRVAILSPYMPWPPSHGGAVRLWELLRETAPEFDILFFGFSDGQKAEDLDRAAGLCARVYVADKPRYREPRWSSVLPPEVCEFYTRELHGALHRVLKEHEVSLLQTEYTQMAAYGGDVLVEHDVTQDLFRQVWARNATVSAWWDYARWRRFEDRAVRRARAVVAMSEKDRRQLAHSWVEVIPNGVDLRRFSPQPEPEAPNLLFVGSFRHFPNVRAWRFFREEIWPLVREAAPEVTVTCVAGPDPHLYAAPEPEEARIRQLGYVADVAPLYTAATLAIVPTEVSAGTNLKALEAMASGRAMVSTPSGVAGLGLVHGESVWIAEGAEAFAEGILLLLRDPALRRGLAARARQLAVEEYGWRALAQHQLRLWRALLPEAFRLRPMSPEDVAAVGAIQAAQPFAARWDPADYLRGLNCVAEGREGILGFLAARETAADEAEILNVAVHPDATRRGVATALVRWLLAQRHRDVFLEVHAENVAARELYRRNGFADTGLRRQYYQSPPGDGIVMHLQK